MGTNLCGLGQRLKKFRTERGLSIKKLAFRTYLGVNTLRMIESGGTYDPRILTLVSLADYYGMTLDDLIGRGEGQDGV